MTRAEGAGEPAVETVGCHEDLVKLLGEEFARADVSLREVQARADRAGGARVPRATCADMLAGRRFPKKAVMVAFLRACRVPEERLPEWERAWERVRISRLPATAQPERPVQALDDPDPDTLPIHLPGHDRRRRLLVPALVAVAMVVAVLAVVALTRGPGTRTISDDGRAFGPGGSSRFTVRVDPANTGVRLTRRLDANVSNQRAAITVNGAPATEWKPLLGGTYGWSDQTTDLPRGLTDGRGRLEIVNTFVSSVWDFNEFLYTVEERVNGAWVVADTVDVGPGHVGSESAHGYQITGQTWRGDRTFDYPPPAE